MAENDGMYRWIGVESVPFVIGLVEATKQMFPSIEARFVPAISILWGVALNLSYAILLGRSVGEAAIEGVAAGLMAVGLFSFSKNTLPNGNASKNMPAKET